MSLLNKFKLAFILIFTMASSVFSQVDEDIAEKFMEITGIEREIVQLDQIFKSQIYEKKQQFDNQKNFELFSNAMQKSFSSNRTMFYFKEFLIQKASQDSLSKIISIYNSPLMKRMSEYESKSANPKYKNDIVMYFKGIKNNPPNQKRTDLILNLNDELKTAELTEILLMNIVKSIMVGMNNMQEREKRMSDDEINNSLNEMLPEGFDDKLKNQIITMSYYTYKDASNSDLTEYIKILKRPISKYYYITVVEALNYTFTNMGEDMGEEIAKNLKIN
jgi:hypothetical protein